MALSLLLQDAHRSPFWFTTTGFGDTRTWSTFHPRSTYLVSQINGETAEMVRSLVVVGESRSSSFLLVSLLGSAAGALRSFLFILTLTLPFDPLLSYSTLFPCFSRVSCFSEFIFDPASNIQLLSKRSTITLLRIRLCYVTHCIATHRLRLQPTLPRLPI